MDWVRRLLIFDEGLGIGLREEKICIKVKGVFRESAAVPSAPLFFYMMGQHAGVGYGQGEHTHN